MSISCKEELQMRLDLLSSKEAKKKLLAGAGRYASHLDGWFVVTDDGECHLINDSFEFDDIKKVKAVYLYMFCRDIKKIKIPDSVAKIEELAFASCDELVDIEMPDSVVVIDSYAFKDCTNIRSMTIPNSVTSIGNDAFNRCTSLTDVAIGNAVKNIGSYAFYNCNNLTDVTIPDSVTSIGAYAFRSCNSLTYVLFKGKTLEQVKSMVNYPWGIKDESIIKTEL